MLGSEAEVRDSSAERHVVIPFNDAAASFTLVQRAGIPYSSAAKVL